DGDRGHPADPRLAEGVRSVLSDDRWWPVRSDSTSHSVHLRDRLHRFPVRIRLSDLIRVLHSDHRGFGDSVPHHGAKERITCPTPSSLSPLRSAPGPVARRAGPHLGARSTAGRWATWPPWWSWRCWRPYGCCRSPGRC